MKYKKAPGFTLIELLIVIAIIGLLASIILVALSDTRKKAAQASAAESLQSIQKAVELYGQDNSQVYPFSGGSVAAYDGNGPVTSGWISFGVVLSPYISKLPFASPGMFINYIYSGPNTARIVGGLPLSGKPCESVKNGYMLKVVIYPATYFSQNDGGIDPYGYELHGGEYTRGAWHGSDFDTDPAFCY